MESPVISSKDLKVPRISFWNSAKTFGFPSRWYVVPLGLEAVVSDPAMISVRACTTISDSVIVFFRSMWPKKSSNPFRVSPLD